MKCTLQRFIITRTGQGVSPMKLIMYLLLVWPLLAAAKDVVVRTSTGGINWSQGVVYANGYGTAKPSFSAAQKRILARRAAVVDAQRNLLEITKGVRITSVIKTGQAMKENPEIKTRVSGIIKGAQIIQDHYQNEIANVTMSMPISGKFLRTMYPTNNLASRNTFDHLLAFIIPPARASESFMISNEPEANAYRKLIDWMQRNASADLKVILNDAVIQYETSTKFSGLVIDASSVPDFELATIPKIRDETGGILYPSEDTSYEDIVNKRGVTYDCDLHDAIRNHRVAATPFIIKAISTYKSLPSDLTISKLDAAKIKQSPSTVVAMNKAGVLIVVAI
jgi:hypothetical protein